MPKKILDQIIEPRGASEPRADALVVFVHGWIDSGSERRIQGIISLIRSCPSLANADLLVPRYDCSVTSNEDPHYLASHIETIISREHAKKAGDYKRIVLVGHSAGSQLIRKAYVYGLGLTSDRPGLCEANSVQHEWTSKVERIVLLGGLNRGWVLMPRPPKMPVIKWGLGQVSKTLARFFRCGKYILQMERGAPFVANLRVQWVNLIQDKENYRDAPAPVFQLLGDKDDIVSCQDSKDVLASSNSTYIPVEGADHSSIADFRSKDFDSQSNLPESSKHHIRLIRSVLEEDVVKLRERYMEQVDKLRSQQKVQKRNLQEPEREQDEETKEKHIVFIMHGIRDFGGWTQDLRREIEALDPEIEIRTPSYGYFSMVKFLLWGDRQKHVRWFMDRYTESIARYKKCKVSFIGHSNGTYVAASALEHYITLKLHRVSFAGSVVHRDFPWDRIINEQERVDVLRNDIAKDDFVVAIFPRFFESLYEFIPFKVWSIGDLGSAGYNGFTEDTGNSNAVKYFIGGHGAALSHENMKSIANFVVNGIIEAPGGLSKTREDDAVSWMSKFSLVTIPLIVLVLVGLGQVLSYYFGEWGGKALVALVVFVLFLA